MKMEGCQWAADLFEAKWCRGVTFINNLFKGIYFQTFVRGVYFLKVFRYFSWRNPYSFYSVIPVGQTICHPERVPPIPLVRYPCFYFIFFASISFLFFFPPTTLAFILHEFFLYFMLNSCAMEESKCFMNNLIFIRLFWYWLIYHFFELIY